MDEKKKSKEANISGRAKKILRKPAGTVQPGVAVAGTGAF